MYLDVHRCIEVMLIFLAALLGSAARMLFGLIGAQDYPPADIKLRILWAQRYRWAIAGEVSAVLLFVMVAEAVVIIRGYSAPTGVILGATAAVLGYPFVAGAVRKRIARKLEVEE